MWTFWIHPITEKSRKQIDLNKRRWLAPISNSMSPASHDLRKPAVHGPRWKTSPRRTESQSGRLTLKRRVVNVSALYGFHEWFRAGGKVLLLEDAPIAPEVPESEVGASDSEFWGLPDFRILLGASALDRHRYNHYSDPYIVSVIVVTE
jgi:hypothetical protein